MPPSNEMWKRFRSLEYGPLRGHRHRDVVALGELDEGRPGVEVPLAPGRDHREVRGQRGVGQLEAHLIVALAGGAVAHRVCAGRAGDLHLGLGDERARDGRAEEIRALVHRVGAQHGEDEVADELLAEILDVHAGGAGAQGLLADGDQLLPLPEVGAVRDHVALVRLDEPAKDHGGIEASGVCQHDLPGFLAHVRLLVAAQEVEDDRFLRVEPVLGLIEDHALRPVEHGIGDLLPRWAGRQCMTSALGPAKRSSASLT
jgi:hypothetical protein